MPIMAIYRAPGINREAYAPYEADMSSRPVPKEALIHLVGFDGGDMCVVDLWETRAAFERFTAETINPQLTAHGIPIVPPQVFEVTAGLMPEALDPKRVLAAVPG